MFVRGFGWGEDYVLGYEEEIWSLGINVSGEYNESGEKW